ncbi:MAG: ATP-binding protein [SAR324 cluster bacterium]|nr:ATP-binding protein [SAR324 cluster bacterium]
MTTISLILGLTYILSNPTDIDQRAKDHWAHELKDIAKGKPYPPRFRKDHPFKGQEKEESSHVLSRRLKRNFPQELRNPFTVDEQGKILHSSPPIGLKEFATETWKEPIMAFKQVGRLIFIGPYPIPGNRVLYLVRPMLRPNLFEVLSFFIWRQKLKFLGLFFASGVFCFYFSWTLTQPIHKLRKASQKLALGEFDSVVALAKTNRKDELGDLARDFTAMVLRTKEALEAHKKLLRNMSHEIRSPLNRLGLAIELVQKKSGVEQIQAFGQIEKEMQRLESMLAQLIYWSKLEQNALSTQKKSQSLNGLLKPIIQDACFEGGEKGNQVVYTAEKDWNVFLDPAVVQSAFENIVRNALHYSPKEAEVTVSIKTNEKFIFIIVQDKGFGLPPEYLEEIFSPFFRVPDGKAISGTGLGLAIAWEAAQLHSGSILAENTNPGLKVTLKLEALLST